MPKDTNPDYWKDYNNLQHVKHALIKNYLNGWLPKLGSWSGRILYLDTHAGRGRHSTGKHGSPLIALQTILSHSYKDNILGKCEVVFTFIEIDDSNCERLREEIKGLGKLPKNIRIDVVSGDCFSALQGQIDYLNSAGKALAPAFIFVDPYGFKVPGEILQQLMKFKGVELFINVIWRELSMAIAQADSKPGMARTLDLIYKGDEWRTLIGMDFDAQPDESVNLLRKMTDAKWATYIRMLGENRVTRYLLLHLTNHDAGRDLMKDCMWKECPDGGFYARSSDNPSQQYLITSEPDLSPLKDWVVAKLKPGPVRWKALIEDVRSEVWRDVHLNKVIRELRKDRIIDGRNYKNKFTPMNDPEIYLC